MIFSIKKLGVLTLSGILFLTSCGPNSSDPSSGTTDSTIRQGNNTSGSANDASSAADKAVPRAESSPTTQIGVTNPNQATIDFLVASNKKEIAWLQAGMEKGSTKEIKDHSKMMLADHQKMGQQVSELIATRNLTAPPVDTVKEVNINDLKGTEWDKAWVNKMVMDHTELLQKLEEAQSAVKDSALLKVVVGAKPMVKSHLDMSKMMQGKMK
jgi:putative membrane protein